MRPVLEARRARAFKGALIAAAFVGLTFSRLSAATVTINVGTKYQSIDGFGAATAWNGISTTEAPVLWTDDSSALVSNTTAHINGHAGLSIVRMRIDPNEEANGTSAWNGELNNLVLARKTNPAITEFATEWTPPVADKENHSLQELNNTTDPTNCFNGLPTTNNGTTGLASADTDYANYLVKFVQYCNSYLTSKGATGTLNAVSVQNEPDWNTTYESALWTGPQFQTFVGSYFGPAMQSAGLSATKIIITESFPDNLGLASNTMNDAVAAPFVGILAGHLYGAPTPPRTLASAGFSHLTNQHYWETEISDLGSGTQDITTGLEEAAWIYNCVALASMNGYNHWWINSTGKDGFYNTSSNTWNHAFYMEGNFSKFVRPGFVRVGTTAFPEGGSGTGNAPVWTTAFVDAAASRVVVVAVNNSTSSHTETFTLSGLGTVSQVAPWQTDSSNNLVQQSLVTVSGGSFSYTLPAQSAITFVGDVAGAVPTSTSTTVVTPVRTSTPSSTRTSTPVATRTASPTLTATRTATASPSKTVTSTPSKTATATVTLSSTASATPTVPLPSATATRTTTTVPPSPTGSPSATVVASPVPSLTASPLVPSATPTAVPPTLTATVFVPSATLTPSPMPPTATRSATALPTATLTRTTPPTATLLPTAQPRVISSINPATLSTSGGATIVVIGTGFQAGDQIIVGGIALQTTFISSTQLQATAPAMNPGTVVVTVQSPGGAQASGSETLTVSSPKATATRSPTAVPSNGTPNILKAVPGPNPNPTGISVQLDGRADYVDVKVYSTSMRLVAEDAVGTGGPGWLLVPLPPGFASYTAAGTYYYQVQAFKSGVGSKPVTGTIVILH